MQEKAPPKPRDATICCAFSSHPPASLSLHRHPPHQQLPNPVQRKDDGDHDNDSSSTGHHTPLTFSFSPTLVNDRWSYHQSIAAFTKSKIIRLFVSCLYQEECVKTRVNLCNHRKVNKRNIAKPYRHGEGKKEQFCETAN